MIGLSSQSAQRNLHSELQRFVSSCKKINWFSEIIHAPYVPISSVTIFIAGLILFVEFFISGQADVTVLLQSLVLFAFAILNIVLLIWELYLLRTRRIRRLLSNVKPLLRTPCPWTARSYPKTPISTFRGQFTVPAYRDGVLVNLPTSLLVKGDIIELHKDIPSPAKVNLSPPDMVDVKQSDHLQTTVELGEIPPLELYKNTRPNSDTDDLQFALNIIPPKFVVTETPIISLLESNVTKQRSKTGLTKERNRIVASMEILVIVVFLISLVYNFVRYFSLPSDFDNSWPDLFLRQPVYTVLPIMLVPLPIIWTIVNLYGTALLTLLMDNETHFSSFQKRTFRSSVKKLWSIVCRMCGILWNSSIYPNYRAFHILGSLTSVCAVDKEYVLTGGFPTPEKMFFLRTEDLAGSNYETMSSDGDHGRKRRVRVLTESTEELSEDENGPKLTSNYTLQEDSIPILEVSTVIERKEKEENSVDSLKHDEPLGFSNPMTGKSNIENHTLDLDTLKVQDTQTVDDVSRISQFSDFIPVGVIKEILDISPTADNTSGVCFDDLNWQDYIGSLKPIGVNLLATSHLSKQNWYLSGIHANLNQMIKQTSCACSLGIEIGVSDYTSNSFEKKMLVYSFSDSVCLPQNTFSRKGGTSLSSLSSSVQPHIISLILKDVGNSNHLLMSRGSGDMVTSCCSDFWDGKDLQPMTDVERTSITDFFNRRSTTGYCIALAYNPLLEVNLSSLKDQNIGIFVPALQMHRSFSEMSMIVDGPSRLSNASQLFGFLQCNQVFLGLLSFQFRPKMDVVALIEDLQIAGIRFVHFTCENEVRGKVFAQKLGLEADWNCHISLAPDAEQEDISSEESSSDLGDSRSSSTSSLSSYQVNTKMSNFHAKLPVGVDKVRPHIKDVDNVPLLVPLFTDCSTDTIQEMIEIMQENSEVVLCLGNAWNRENLSIFSQADISLSLIPEYVESSSCLEAETCALSTSNSSQNAGTINRHQLWPTPLEMAAYLNSTTSQLCFSRERDVSLLCLITESRHIQSVIRHGLLFGLGCYLSIVLLMLIAELLFLPPPLDGSHLFWFVFFVIPLLCLSFLSTPVDPRIKSRMPARKKQILSEKYLFVFNFLMMFVPTVALCELLFGVTLCSVCTFDIPSSDCHLLLGNRNSSSLSNWNGWNGDHQQGLILSQDFVAFFLCVYFVTLSIRFIHRTKPLWKLWKYTSWQYICLTASVLILQVIYFAISQTFAIYVNVLMPISDLSSIPFYLWIIALVWPIVLVFLQEFLKYQDKSMLFKLQTHLKLEFETRLGMYSPM